MLCRIAAGHADSRCWLTDVLGMLNLEEVTWRSWRWITMAANCRQYMGVFREGNPMLDTDEGRDLRSQPIIGR